MRSVPSNEHCGQYGGVGNREYVMVMVVMQSVAVLGNSTTDGICALLCVARMDRAMETAVISLAMESEERRW